MVLGSLEESIANMRAKEGTWVMSVLMRHVCGTSLVMVAVGSVLGSVTQIVGSKVWDGHRSRTLGSIVQGQRGPPGPILCWDGGDRVVV